MSRPLKELRGMDSDGGRGLERFRIRVRHRRMRVVAQFPHAAGERRRTCPCSPAAPIFGPGVGGVVRLDLG